MCGRAVWDGRHGRVQRHRRAVRGVNGHPSDACHRVQSSGCYRGVGPTRRRCFFRVSANRVFRASLAMVVPSGGHYGNGGCRARRRSGEECRVERQGSILRHVYDGLGTLRSVRLPYSNRCGKGSNRYASRGHIGGYTYRTSGSLARQLVYLYYYHYSQHAAGSYLI